MASPDNTLEVQRLTAAIREFMNLPVESGSNVRIGQCKTGVYAFFDYDNEPIYVGQTRENFRTRIGRHLTGQRTDAVAKSVLDPFEVRYIAVWPLSDGTPNYSASKEDVNALEWMVHRDLIETSRFGVILNEADPLPNANIHTLSMPNPVKREIISADVLALRGHIDIRLARRAQTIANLARIISEREIKNAGIRRVLMAQAKRLSYMAEDRYQQRGGDAAVAEETSESSE